MRYTLHLDSINSLKANNNSFDCTFLLGSFYKNVKSVTLKTCEIPVCYYNIRTPYNSITIDAPSGQEIITVQPGNYTTSTIPLTSVNGTFQASSSNNIMTFSSVGPTCSIKSVPPFIQSNIITFDKFSNIGGQMTKTFIRSDDQQLTALSPDLGWILGFTGEERGSRISGTNSFNLNYDTYVRICLPFVGMSSREIHQTTFKVPIIAPYGGINFYVDDISNRQTVFLNGAYSKFDRLSVQVRDRFGNVISNNGVDWSLSLEIECEF
jgi:hypothetical protein